MRWVQDTAVILGREQARLQEELELVRRQVAQLAQVMQVTHSLPCHFCRAALPRIHLCMQVQLLIEE